MAGGSAVVEGKVKAKVVAWAAAMKAAVALGVAAMEGLVPSVEAAGAGILPSAQEECSRVARDGLGAPQAQRH